MSRKEKEILLYPYFPFKIKYIRPFPFFNKEGKHMYNIPIIVAKEICVD